ncbi:hypothetical protein QFZ37_001312 [Chryseobacterium ginsenosidimutans]|uniref:hypothetical protein n=1 Tax=Chryseobacterium ginsenosidimutans TaxID=687846 RepID=UPI0027865AC0|nr:hypothetical protein [Chryseobacterium ginsenosidimutans]MDQ0592943.1 hypothetical protein [Chryseobacterium ginsenosidimutans]
MRKSLQLLLLLNFFIFLNAQNKSTLSINSNSLNVLAKDYRKIYASTKEIISNLLADNKTSPTTDNFNFAAANVSLNTTDFSFAHKSSEKNTLNINWISEVNYNFSPGFADEDNIFYRARISSGLDWLALGEGSSKNQRIQNSLNENARKINILEKSQYKKEINYRESLAGIKGIFDERKIEILSDYERILKLLNEFDMKQNKSGIANDAELARSKYRLEKISIEKKSLEDLIKNSKSTFNKEILNASIPDLTPVENIDLSILVKDKELALKMEKEMLSIRNKKDRQPDLRLKLRYNYYSALSKDRNFASLGASLNLPLSRSKTNLDNENDLKFKENMLTDLQMIYRDKLNTIYREYYLLKSEIDILQSESTYLESDLKLKSTNEESNTFSPAGYLISAESFLNNQLQIYDKKSHLYEKYLEYRMTSGADYKNEQPQYGIDDDNVGHETYIWSALFNNYSNTYIINLMNHWHINRVFLSVGKVPDLVKIENFKTEAAANNIQVYRLIGENSYAKTDDGFIDLQQALIEAKNMGFAGVHLDIEPHTFDDYKENIDLYSQRLINLFTSSKIWCDQNNMGMGVSVPMHLPVNVATALNENNVMSYIMAYDILSLDKKINKTAAIRSILGTNYVWVFRINDFQNFNDLLNAETIVQSNGISQIGYYDLSQMNNFKP